MKRRVSSKSSTKSTFKSFESRSRMVRGLYVCAKLNVKTLLKFKRNKFPARVVKDRERQFHSFFEAGKHETHIDSDRPGGSCRRGWCRSPLFCRASRSRFAPR